MSTYKHLRFLANNRLGLGSFSQPVARKADIFQKKLNQVPHLVGEDRDAVIDALDELDQEIYMDMLDEMEERLSNNELADPAEEAGKPNPAAGKSKTDEDVLRDFWSKGKRSDLSEEVLRQAGFRGNLNGIDIRVGKGRLQRSSAFRVEFRLTMQD